jgi:hypothetical protein
MESPYRFVIKFAMPTSAPAERPENARLPRLLDEMFPWLNSNLPVNPAKPLTAQDVAHISLTAAEFSLLPGEAMWCAHRRVSIKRYREMEFWLSNLNLPELQACEGLRGRVAWKLTGNTAPLFRH